MYLKQLPELPAYTSYYSDEVVNFKFYGLSDPSEMFQITVSGQIRNDVATLSSVEMILTTDYDFLAVTNHEELKKWWKLLGAEDVLLKAVNEKYGAFFNELKL